MRTTRSRRAELSRHEPGGRDGAEAGPTARCTATGAGANVPAQWNLHTACTGRPRSPSQLRVPAAPHRAAYTKDNTRGVIADRNAVGARGGGHGAGRKLRRANRGGVVAWRTRTAPGAPRKGSGRAGSAMPPRARGGRETHLDGVVAGASLDSEADADRSGCGARRRQGSLRDTRRRNPKCICESRTT